MGDYIIVIVKEQNITDFQTKYRIFGTICDKHERFNVTCKASDNFLLRVEVSKKYIVNISNPENKILS